MPLLEGGDIAGKDVTGDALLTQRALARYLVEQREAADFVEITAPDHGRIETRRIGCSTALNAYLDFPYVGQVFLIEPGSLNKKTGAQTCEIALGITSRTPQQASPQRVLAVNRGHWSPGQDHQKVNLFG